MSEFDDDGFGGEYDYNDFGGGEDYGFGEDYDDEGYGDEGFGRGFESDDEEGMRLGSEDRDDMGYEDTQYGTTFGDFGRVVQSGAGGVVTTHLGRVEKSSRTPLERFIDETSGTLTTAMFDEIRETHKDFILHTVREIPHVERYNVITMITALWWRALSIELTRKNFEDFFKRLRGNEVAEIDLLRYIRMLDHKL